MKISIDLEKNRLKLTSEGRVLLDTSIVQGCAGTPSPSGQFLSGKWIKDPWNKKFGSGKPWAKDQWGNPYGPYFLEIYTESGADTKYGIHGTRGPGWSPVAEPPIPPQMLSWFFKEEEIAGLYCSSGCIRISNRDIVELFSLTAKVPPTRIPIEITRN